jgi:amino acid transporter
MTEEKKLSFWQATLITINVMFGSGIFINTVNLGKIAGVFGFLSYATVALILLPLIFSLMALVKRYPEGGFYVYAAKELGSYWGFLSAWAYATGKLASAALLIHVFTMLIRTIITPLAAINPFLIDFFILGIFMWLNHYALKTSTRIIYGFIFCKVTPILFAILASIYLMGNWHVPTESLLFSGIPLSIPLVLYAFVGFETACSISLRIENPARNAARVILYSFLFTVIITTLYQLVTFLAIGPQLMKAEGFLEIFPTFFVHLFVKHHPATVHIVNIFHIAAAVSALGGSYGMIFSNAWNFYVIAENKHMFFSETLTNKNSYGIPFGCVLFEGFICAFYMIVTQANQIILQQISVFGCSIAFLLSVLALLKIHYAKKEYLLSSVTQYLACASTTALLIMCIRNFSYWGIEYLLLFIGNLVCGSLMYRWQRKITAI